ncbi:MAG: hypothetical protein NTY98_28350 [Verrucomicrobia bacterium]|nr:hypothetical protein [Verrucomicrobiota bacterium]
MSLKPDTITGLKWTGPVLSWQAAGALQHLEFQRDVANALMLHSEGIAVVLVGKNLDDRALILNADGSMRAELKNPFLPEEGKVFYYFMYERERLIVVLASSGRGDFKCDVDEATGALSKPQETR